MFSLDKIRAKTQDWMTCLFSYVGRLQLLKSVLSGMTQFWIYTFKPTKRLINHICRLFSAFLWRQKAESDSLHNESWKKIWKPFIGRGFVKHDLTFNLASLGKLFWRVVLTIKDSLLVKWIQDVYILNHSIWCAQPHSFSRLE